MKSQPHEYFEEGLRHVWHTLVEAEAHIEAARQIRRYGREVDTGLEDLNSAPTFWKLTITAHQSYGLICLWTVLTDTDRRVHSLPRLINFLDSNPQLTSLSAHRERIAKRHRDDPSEIEFWMSRLQTYNKDYFLSLRKQLASVRDVSDSLTQWRNKRLTHADASVIGGTIDLKEKYPIPWLRLEDAFKTAGEVLNGLSEAVGLGEFQMGERIVDDVRAGIDFTLQSAHLGVTRRREEALRQLNDWQADLIDAGSEHSNAR